MPVEPKRVIDALSPRRSMRAGLSRPPLPLDLGDQLAVAPDVKAVRSRGVPVSYSRTILQVALECIGTFERGIEFDFAPCVGGHPPLGSPAVGCVGRRHGATQWD